jgi:hypothetical protein
MDYDDLLKEVIGATAESTIMTECKMESPVSNVKKAIEAGKKEKRIWGDGFTKQTSILDSAEPKAKLEFAERIEDVQKRLSKVDAKKNPKEFAALVDELDKLENRMSREVLSYDVERRADIAINTYENKMRLYGDESFRELNKYKFEETDNKAIIAAINDENKEFTTEYILNSLEKDLKSTGKSKSKVFNDYYAEKGDEAIGRIKSVVKTFQALAKMGELPEERLLKQYLPSMTAKLKGLDDTNKAVVELLGTFDNTKNAKLDPFFKKIRTGEFDTNLTIPEMVHYYQNAIKRSILHKSMEDIMTEVAKRADGAGWEPRHVKAVHNIVKNIVSPNVPDEFVQRIRASKRFFQEFTLFGNIGSSINNYTSLATMINPKYGTEITTNAYMKTFQDHAINDFLDDFGIGTKDNTIASYDYNELGVHKQTHWMDGFSKTEQHLVRTTAIAHMIKKYGSFENALEVLRKADEIPSPKDRLNKYTDILTAMKSDIADVLFHNKIYDKPEALKGAFGEVYNGLMTLIRHPLRESRMLWKLGENLASPAEKTRGEAAKQLTRYLTAKALFMGKKAVWFAVPVPVMQMLDTHAPEVRKNVEEISSVLEFIALPKLMASKVGLDLEMSQYVTWPIEILQDIAGKGEAKLATTQFTRKSWQAAGRIIEGKGKPEDWVRLSTLGLAIPGKGTLGIGGIALGGRQTEKAVNAIIDVVTGDLTYWGIERKIEDFDDVKEAIARGVFTLTPDTAKIIKANSQTSHENTRRYVKLLAARGKMDKSTFNDLVSVYNGDKAKLKKSLVKSVKSSEMPKDWKNKAVRTINGY